MAEGNRKLDTGVEEPVPHGATEPTNTDTGTTKTGKRTRKRIDTGTDTGAVAGATEKKELLGLADVDVPKPEEPKKAKRPRKKTVKNDTAFNAEQITGLLMGFSAIMSQSETGKIFALSESEAKTIAEPLANLIAKNDSLSKLGEHSDSIALASVCFMIFVPKFIAFLAYHKQMKALKEKNAKVIKGSENNGTQRTNSGSASKANGNDADAVQNDDEGILSGLPSIAL